MANWDGQLGWPTGMANWDGQLGWPTGMANWDGQLGWPNRRLPPREGLPRRFAAMGPTRGAERRSSEGEARMNKRIAVALSFALLLGCTMIAKFPIARAAFGATDFLKANG